MLFTNRAFGENMRRLGVIRAQLDQYGLACSMPCCASLCNLIIELAMSLLNIKGRPKRWLASTASEQRSVLCWQTLQDQPSIHLKHLFYTSKPNTVGQRMRN